MSQAEDNTSSTATPTLQQKDVYRELRLRGYQYGGLFQGIVKADLAGECLIRRVLCVIKNWITLLELV